MLKSFSDKITPATGEKWGSLNHDSRIEMIAKELKKDKLYDGFEAVEAPDNGQIVLRIEPRHFGALSGQAQIYIELEEYEKALDSLKKASKIYPVIRGNKLIPDLKKLIKKQSI